MSRDHQEAEAVLNGNVPSDTETTTTDDDSDGEVGTPKTAERARRGFVKQLAFFLAAGMAVYGMKTRRTSFLLPFAALMVRKLLVSSFKVAKEHYEMVNQYAAWYANLVVEVERQLVGASAQKRRELETLRNDAASKMRFGIVLCFFGGVWMLSFYSWLVHVIILSYLTITKK